MNSLVIAKIRNTNISVTEISAIFDKEKIEYNSISYVNWIEYPYKPDVKFRVAHDGSSIYLNCLIDEKDIKAICDKDGGNVWEDSCVEFFLSFDGKTYYNIECNCIGKMVIAIGCGKDDRVSLSKDLIEKVERWSSLGTLPIEGKSGKWELSLIIPVVVFGQSNIKNLDGIHAKGNFYKCGDNLKTPHFLSWNPIDNKTPNFHLSQFFGNIQFERSI